MKLQIHTPKRTLGVLLASVLTVTAMLPSAPAASQSWSGATNGNWGTGTNWSNNAAPGAITGTANGDTATFNSNPSNKLITVDANRNIKNITFDLAGCGIFTIGSLGANAGNSLLLSSGGAITVINKVVTAQTINAPLIIQGNNGTYSVDASGGTGGTIALNGNITAAAGNAILNLNGAYQPAGALVNVVGGVIGNGSATSLSLNKGGGGWWTLTGSNTYTGSTSVNVGTLTLGGADGSILNSSSITLGGGTLKLDNSTNNNTDRLPDDVGIVSMGNTGGINFAVNGTAGNFSETAGTLTLAAGLTNLTSNQAVAGGTSTLTFASLNRLPGAGLNNIGTNLGMDARNRIMFTADPSSSLVNGVFPWSSSNSGAFLTYGANGLTPYTAYTNINALGSTLADSGTSNVKITAAGSGGNMALGATETSVNSLSQGVTTAVTVATAGKTLRTNALVTTPSSQTLRIGAAVGDGTLTPMSSGGELVLNTMHNSTSSITVNAVIADNETASSLTKLGIYTAVLPGNNTISGTTYVGQGTLQLGSGGTTGSVGGPLYIAPGALLTYNRTDASTPFGTLSGGGGGVTVNSGTLIANSAAGAQSFGTFNLAANTGMVFNGNSSSVNTFTAGHIVGANSTLTINGGTNSLQGVGFTGSNSVLTIAGGVNTLNGSVWPNNSQSGVYLTGGTTAFTGNNLILAYGGNFTYFKTGANATASGAQIGVGFGTNTIGVLDMSGTMTIASGGGGSGAYFGNANGSVGVYNQAGGSLLANNGILAIGAAGTGRGEFNLSGGTIGGVGTNAAHNMTVAQGATTTGAVNLNGGTMYLTKFNNSNNLGSAFVNFNGGTLAANSASTTFFPAAAATGVIYSGGATIDDSGFAITIGAPLTAPTGYGVTSLPVSGTLNGYVGAPYVSITGGSGSGAMAVAEYDETTRQVTGIRLTNPGVNYGASDVLTVTLKTGTAVALQYTVPGSTLLGQNVGGGLTKVGTGVTTLTGTNTYTGNTNINAGTLLITATNALPGWDTNGRYTVASGATLGVTNAVNEASVGTILGTGNFAAGGAFAFDTSTADRTHSLDITDPVLGITKLGTNTLTLGGSNSYTGLTSIASGILKVGNSSAIVGPVAITNGARLDLNGNDLSLPGLSGSGSIINGVAGTKTLTLEANNASVTYSGTLAAGTGVLALVKSGNGGLTLNGNNTFTGGVTFNSGTLSIGNNNALGTGTLTYNGGSLGLAANAVYSLPNAVRWNADVTYDPVYNNQMNFNGAMVLDATRTFNVNAGAGFNLYGGISDGGNGYGLIKTGNSLMRLGGTNTYTGDTRVEPGSFGIVLWHNLAMQNSAFDTDGGGTLGITQATVNAPVLGGLKGSGNWSVGNVVGNLIINSGAGVTNTYSGILSGGTSTGMSLTKNGLGTQIFSGSTVFTGTTLVNSGTLGLGNGGVLGNSSSVVHVLNGATVSVGNGGVLNNSGNFKITGTSAIYLEDGGRINATGSGGVVQFIPDATSGLANAGKLGSTGSPSTSGTMHVTASTFRPAGINNSNYTFNFDNVTVSATNSTFEVGRGGVNNIVNITGASHLYAGSANIAIDASNYTLNLTQGSSLTLNNGNLFLKGGGGANNTLNIDDNSAITGVNGVSFGGSPNSSINITNGGLLSSKSSTISANNALVSVSGLNSHWNLNGGSLGIGVISGTGETVEVADGGKITAGAVSMTSGSTYLNFDNGTLAAAANGTLLASAGGIVSVKNGGAIIDSGTFASNISTGIAEHGESTGGGLTKIGTGSLTMSADSNFTGATNVNFGKLVVSGSLTATTAVNVASGAELSVNGLINNSAAISVAGKLSGAGTVGAVTLASTATVAPGNSPGVLTMTSLTGTAGAALSIELGKSTAGVNPDAGSDYDRLVADEVALNDTTLSLSTGVNFSNVELGDMFFIVVNNGLYGSGTFAGLAQGDTVTLGGMDFAISYNANWTGTYSGSAMDGGNDVALLAVPEPSTWAMLVGGFGMLLSFQRLRRNRR